MSCATSNFLVGARPVVVARFLNDDDDLTDPSSIVVKTRSPTGTTTTYTSPHATITTTGTGIWEFQFPAAVTTPGKWWVYIVGSGNGVDVASEVALEFRGAHVAV